MLGRVCCGKLFIVNSMNPVIAPPVGHRPLPTLIALLPFILLLEVTLLSGGFDSTASRVLAHVQLGEVLRSLGLSPIFILHATGLLVIAILIAWHALTGASWRIHWGEPLQLIFEGVISAAPLLAGAAFLGTLSDTTLTINGLAPDSSLDAIATAIGAGLSEELLFRMIGVAAVYWPMVTVVKLTHNQSIIVAFAATPAAFTLYHGPSAMTTTAIVFVLGAGLYLGALYVLRGFAVVVIAHAVYDAVVLLASSQGSLTATS